jgi:MOSC domain-containing protein YiiM
MMISLESVQLGRVAPLGAQAVPSGYVKRPVPDAVRITTLGIVGDEQADLSVHGGLEKAVYGYAAGHYPAWRADCPQYAALFVAGGMGENLTIAGLDEDDLRIGDVHRIGTALLQVCQPRQPCFKFAAYFGDARMPRAMVRSGRSGWYYRVLEEGECRAGDAVELVDRSDAGVSFVRLTRIINGGGATADEAAALAAMPALASDWRRRFAAAG